MSHQGQGNCCIPDFSSKLLSEASRDECIENIKNLSNFNVFDDVKINTTAAVLLPLCIVDGEVSLLYTLRSLQLKTHKGQVSFPGGKSECGETAIETALREAEEEIGIDKKNTEIWCQMPSMPIFYDNKPTTCITPVVGVLKDFDMNKLIPNKSEVEEIFTVPIRHLTDTSCHAHMIYKKVHLPIYLYYHHKIWGITGLITHYFLQSLLPPDVYQPDFKRKRYLSGQLRPPKL